MSAWVPQLRRAAILFLALLPAGCRRTQDRPPAFSIKPVVVQAADDFRAAFNGGDCMRIYDEAAPAFRDLQTREDWLAECGRLRQQYGALERWDARMDRPGWHGTTAHLAGTAVFSTGACILRTAWMIEDGRARLFHLSLWDDRRSVTVPAPWRLNIPLIDPPPKIHRNRRNS